MDELIHKIFEEEFESTKRRILTRINRIVKDGNQTSERNMKLEFRNRISEVILTGEEIKGEGDTSIEVVIVDESSGHVVDVGPEASANVGIVLLKGEPDALAGDAWTVQEYNENIVQEIEGKQPLLAGKVLLKLQKGIGFLENIKLRHHASKIRPPVFRLGARVVDTFDESRIKEAKTVSFTVKDFRNKYYKKHETPSLSDEVSRLVNIRKGGKINKRLQDNKIYTVEDFLIRLLIDPEELRSIVNLGPKKWELTVNNARASLSDKRMYCYVNSEQKMGIVFNVLGQVLGLYLKNQYVPTNILSENNKASVQELLASAYAHWGNVKPFDDENSLRQYFTGFTTSMDPPDHLNPNYRGGGRENPETSEMIGESSSRSCFSYQSISSAMNYITETEGGDFGSFSTNDVEIIHDIPLQRSPDWTFNPDTMFQDFDEFLHQKDSFDWQVNCPVNEPNAEEQIAETAVAFADTYISNPPNRWRKLFCVSRWFSIRKRVSMAGIHNRKKRKVH
ncbi:calmodulin-binding protein 60 A isoform X1 [Sesamum indicum]|uniref:Calmodulin-binding protein 60 A isoform X1 n=2 Tax=Sesamum indicum TaxID=4182 RepID=A0A6I9SW97_SESIN|nr:calmodulin-binding protein 60 A isoform X1 [Sesamum indicum]XP_011071794.1 calmodulin-binding protein 60 A isoform X1 [Sesamum indicum]XP_020548361.1 calmodulin-binding protein 60 A isoform X1 [Sesamum indicum]